MFSKGVSLRIKSLYRKVNTPLFHDSLWAIIGNISLRGLGLLGSIFVARFLGSEVFGEYGAVKNTVVSIAIFSTYGLGYTSTKYVADYNTNNPLFVRIFIRRAYNITLFFGVVISLFSFFFSSVIAKELLNAPHLSELIKYVSLWIIFNALTTLQIGILSGLGLYKEMAKLNTIVGLFTFGFTVVLTWFYQLEGAIFALLISQIFNWYLYYRLVKSSISRKKTNLSDNEISYKEILIFSFPIAMQEMVYSTTSWLSCLILIKYSTYSQLGLYTASLQWSSVVLFIPAVLRNVALSNLSKERNKNTHSLIIKKMILINIMATVIPILIIIVFSGFITRIYGVTFINMQNLLYISLFSTVFISVNSVYSQAYMSIGKNWIMFMLRLLRDIVILSLTICFIVKQYFAGGALALALATLLSNIVFMVLMGCLYNFNFQKK